MPASNEEFIKKAFEAGLNEDQVRKAVAERNQMLSGTESQKPQWSDLPGNILPSAGKNISDMWSAVTHPVQTAKGVGSMVTGGVEKLIPGQQGQEQNFDALVGFFKDRYGSLPNVKQTIIEDPAGFLLDLSTVLSAGAGLAGKTAQVGKIGTLGKAAEVAGQAGRTLDPIEQVLKATGTAGKLVEKAGVPVVSKVEQVAKELPLRGVRISPSQQLKFQETIGMPVAEFIEKHKLAGNPVEKGIKLAEETQEKFDKIALQSGRAVSAETIKAAFDQRIADLTSDLNAFLPENAKLAQDLANRRDMFLKGMGNKAEVGVDQLTQLRRKTDEFVKPTQFLANPDVAAANVQVRRILNDLVQEATADIKVGGQTIKELGRDLHGLYEFNDMAAKTALPTSKGNLMNLLRGGIVGGGVATGNVPAVALGLGIEQAAQHPTVLNVASKAVRTGTGVTRAVGKTSSSIFGALQRALLKANEAARTTGARMLPRVTSQSISQ